MATAYRVVPEDQASAQRPVLDVLTAPPGGESKGDRYIVDDSATGAWSGHDGEIAYCTGTGPTTWAFDTPTEGWESYDLDSGKYLQYDGAAWIERPGGTATVTAPLTLTVADAATNTVTDILTVEHTTSGTAAAGFGAGIPFKLENAAGTSKEAASIDAAYKVATNGSEESYLALSAMLAGSVSEFGRFGAISDGYIGDGLRVTAPGEQAELVLRPLGGDGHYGSIYYDNATYKLYVGGSVTGGACIVFDDDNGRVGILNASPDYTLDVTGDIHTTTHYRVDQATSTDHTGCGILAPFTAGETVAAGQAVYIKSDGKVWKADADAATSMPAIGIVETGGNADATVTVLTHGFFRDDSWNWTVGGIVYVDTATAGGLTQTAPSGTGDQVQAFGIATHADRIMVCPSITLVEVA